MTLAIFTQAFLATLGGLFLGLIFFGGLRLTVKEVTGNSKNIWILPFSFLIRSFITIYGIWWIAKGSLLLIGFCMLGWVFARFLFLYLDKKYFKINSSMDGS
ncbi:MAG: hypothetical protein GW761_07550 [Leptospira sp.]|nr:hypothetical protein [Leptospira sp.]